MTRGAAVPVSPINLLYTKLEVYNLLISLRKFSNIVLSILTFLSRFFEFCPHVLSNYLLTGYNLVISRDTSKKTDSIMI